MNQYIETSTERADDSPSPGPVGGAVGRSHVLCLDDIVEATLRLGLDCLTVKTLAAELNCAAGTFYYACAIGMGWWSFMAKRQWREFQGEQQVRPDFLGTLCGPVSG